MRPQPMICVSDVEAISRFYQYVLGCKSGHGGPHYEQLIHNGKLVMQLHHWNIDDHHGPIGDVASKPYGNGVLLWFEVDDFDAAVARVYELNAPILLPPHRNPPDGDGGPNHRECWFSDPEGYKVVIASPYGEAGPMQS